MKIIHVCLTTSYNTGWIYQENLLSDQNVKDGHQTMIITTPYELQKTSENYDTTDTIDYIEPNGVRVLRLKPAKFLGHKAQMKIRCFPALKKILNDEKPDVIFFHGLCSWEILTVAKYLKEHKNVVGFADYHGSPLNSATNFLSRYILHSLFYRTLFKFSKKYFKTIFYIGIEGKDFLSKLYGIDKKHGDDVKFMTLGGIEVDQTRFESMRNLYRAKLNLGENDVAFLHTGKMNASKGLFETLETFDKCNIPNAKLFLAGGFSDDVKDKALSIVNSNKNITYLGWLSGENLIDYMCACDVLIQPRSQSVSYQQAICARMATILGNNENNRFLVSGNNGYTVDSNADILKYITELSSDKNKLNALRENAKQFAQKELLYSQIAKLIY